MAFFKALEAIGIGRSELAGVSNESLIRIEKKLIAEQKLNNTFSKNDVEKVLYVIKNYPDVLEQIARYDCLYGILTGYEAENIDTVARYTPEMTERIKLVVSDYFFDELTDYINLNLNQNNWNNIRVLLHYSVFFNNAVIKMLTNRLEAKVEAAIGNIQQQITPDDLRNKFNYIRDKDFYFTLGEVNKQYFLRVIVRLIDQLKQNAAYASKSGFFNDIKQAIQCYDVSNHALANKLGIPAYQQQGRVPVTRAKTSTARIVYIIIVICSALFNITRSCNSTTTTTTPYPLAQYALKPNPLGLGHNDELTYGLDSTRSDQKLKMDNFIAARIHPVNFPPDSLKTASGNIRKYQDPFGLDIFDRYYAAIKNDWPAMGIVNRTAKECVVIAYYRQGYNEQQKNYEPLDNDNSINIFPLYIPAHDSISVDLKMTLLRFYMGQRLSAFKSSPLYNYPDSTDMKFTRFTPADSMLFSKAFWFNDKYVVNPASSQAGGVSKPRKKMVILTISQPSPGTYRLSWTGDIPLREYHNNKYQQTEVRTDSITKKKPLLYDLKNQKQMPDATAVNSFIYY